MVIKKSFNELTNKELWQIAMLRVNVFALEQNIKVEELEIDDYDAIHYFIKKDEIIIAYARVLFTNNVYKLGRVCTNLKYRNKGFQKEIINAIIKDYNNLVVSSQEEIVSFYEKFGFKKVGKKYLEAGIMHQKLVLDK